MKKRQTHISTTVIIMLALLLCIFGAAADSIGYYCFTKTLTAQYGETALSVADLAASSVRAEDLDGFLESNGTSDAYRQAQSDLQTLCDRMDAEFIYIIDTTGDDCGEIMFLFEVVNRDSAFPPYEVGHTQPTTNEEYRARYKELYAGEIEHAYVVRDKGAVETGSHITALVPIRDDEQNVRALLAVQLQMEYLGSARRGYLAAMVLVTLVLIVVAGTAWFIIIQSRLLKPISDISREAQRFSTEYTLPKVPLADRMNASNEIGTLAGSLDEMESKTLDYFTSLEKVTEEKRRVDTELSFASDIQAAMLPRSFPLFPEHDEFDVFAAMDPAREVGGDFYDAFMIGDHKAAVVIGDVSDKGVPAALVMVITKTLIKNHAQLGMTPEEVFTRVNDILSRDNDACLFITAWMGVLDLTTGVMTCVNAGHNPPFLCRADGSVTCLRSKPCIVLAAMDGVRYTSGTLTLSPGDRLFLYTDGVTEAMDKDGQLYGEERLTNYLTAHVSDAERDLLHGLRTDMDGFTDGAVQSDDVTMLVLDYLRRQDAPSSDASGTAGGD